MLSLSYPKFGTAAILPPPDCYQDVKTAQIRELQFRINLPQKLSSDIAWERRRALRDQAARIKRDGLLLHSDSLSGRYAIATSALRERIAMQRHVRFLNRHGNGGRGSTV